MLGEAEFADLVRRIRAGEQDAAAELVRRYEPLIRREVRMHLEDGRLRRAFDSVDVSQSVLASFFLRATAGQYDLSNPQQLAQLLVTMARNKVASQVRREQRQRRDVRRLQPGDEMLAAVPDGDPTPSEVVACEELLQSLREQLSADERQIVDLRREGASWAAVAEQLGGTAQARRMQLVRALDRISRALGLAE